MANHDDMFEQNMLKDAEKNPKCLVKIAPNSLGRSIDSQGQWIFTFLTVCVYSLYHTRNINKKLSSLLRCVRVSVCVCVCVIYTHTSISAGVNVASYQNHAR